MRSRLLSAALAATALAAGIGAGQPQPAIAQSAPAAVDTTALGAALADPRRAEDRARDAHRHPGETLAFMRVAPGMTVLDYLPSGGWYTRVLVPYLGDKGHYIGLLRPRGQFDAKAVADAFVTKAVGWTGAPAGRIAAYTAESIPATLDGTVDRVLIFREVHNMVPNGWLYPDLRRARALLKPDGLLGIEEHRARADASADYADGTKGYMREKDVIALIEAMGFELVARSEVNANPKDTANWPEGVWTLPPTLALGDKDRARYTAIGESDRMTLLFRKRP